MRGHRDLGGRGAREPGPRHALTALDTDSLAEGERLLSSIAWDDDHDTQQASVHAQLAFALWRLRRDRTAALRHAWEAIELNRRDETAAWVIRDVTDVRSPAARYMNVIVCGRWPYPLEGETEPLGFLVSYQVVADGQEEALELIRPFEPEAVRDSLTIDECILGEAAPHQPKGVYEALGGRTFFPLQGGDD